MYVASMVMTHSFGMSTEYGSTYSITCTNEKTSIVQISLSSLFVPTDVIVGVINEIKEKLF